MSLVPLAAPLIRLATTDENYAIDLDVSLRADDRAREALLHAAIEPDDLRWMAPSEWRWFARWRQARGGPLDLVVLNHLERTDASRAGRFELRSLVMRDPETEDLATRAPGRPPEASVGLVWLEQQARGFGDAPELALDALQIATEPAWFVLRVLTALDDPRNAASRLVLRAFASEREIPREISSRWTTDGEL
jgi:hypothetical protein